MSEKTTGTGHPGQMGLWGGTSEFNNTFFLVKQLLALVRTASLVQVQSCTNAGGLAPVGTVDVLPLVKMIDGLGNSSAHGKLVQLPYARIQGGGTAIICDPVKGDIGVAVFSDRDISAVKNSKKMSNPGSRRKHSLADGIYLFGVLNAAPTQYVRFMQDGSGNPAGFELVDVYGNKSVFSNSGITTTDKFGNKIEMIAAGVKINGVLIDMTGNVSGIAKLTTTDTASLGGGTQFVKLADGSNATKVKAS
jgi:hypothetical protein